MKRLRWNALFLLLVSLFISYAGEPFPDLFGDAVEIPDTPLPPGALRRRFVTIDTKALLGTDSEKNPEGVTLNFFDDVQLIGMRDRIEVRGLNDLTWYGKVSEDPFSSIVLVLGPSGWVGGVSSGSKKYLFKRVEEPIYELIEANAERPNYENDMIVPPADRHLKKSTMEEEEHEKHPQSPLGALAGIPADDGKVVDVLVAYTAGAVTSAKAQSGDINTYLQYFLSHANLAHSNSGTGMRLRIVHSYQTSYTEVGGTLATDLTRLADKTDGYIDEVHAKRDLYGADLVYLLIGHSTGSTAGVAYLAQPTGSYGDPSEYGFAVSKALTSSTIDFNAQTFTHEIGHNLGCAHDRPNSSVSGAYSYSYGWGQNGNYGTIMSYVGTTIYYFSNPSITIGGTTIGVVESSPSSANNTLSIQNMRDDIAAYRKAVVPESSSVDKMSFAGCFIATATYGSPMEKEVYFFRQFRNNYLASTRPGRALMRAYYKLSPPLAQVIHKNENLRKLTRILLQPLLDASKYLEMKLVSKKLSEPV